jgi:hypothetical protein
MTRTDAELKAAHKRFLVELLLEQAAPPVRSDRARSGPLDSSEYGQPISDAQADRNYAVLEAAISTRHHYDPDSPA